MQCEQLVERYLEHLHDGFSCEPAPGGYVLTTPFFGPDNDAIEVYVRDIGQGGPFEVSDRGEILRYLNSFGTDFMRTPQRAEHLRRVVRSNETMLMGDEIRALATDGKQLPEVVDRVVHALREAAGLSHLLRTSVRPSFREQVNTFLRQLPLGDQVREGEELQGRHGSWRVDFYINGTMNMVVEAMTASTAGYAQGQLATTFMKLMDLHYAMPNLRAFAVLDDQEGRTTVWSGIQLDMLREHAQVLPWTNRSELGTVLASRRTDEMPS